MIAHHIENELTVPAFRLLDRLPQRLGVRCMARAIPGLDWVRAFFYNFLFSAERSITLTRAICIASAIAKFALQYG